MTYSVNYWGSEPGTNDDCHSCEDFDTLEDAVKRYKTAPPSFVAWIELDGPNQHRERKNPGHKATRDDWRREIANEEGMLSGIRAFNEVMGY